MKRQKKFTLVEIMIVVAIIGLLAAIAIPSFLSARNKSMTNSCVANLKQVHGAKESYAMDAGLTDGASCEMSDLTDNNWIESAPSPPAGGSYSVNAIGTDPECPNDDTLTDHVLP